VLAAGAISLLATRSREDFRRELIRLAQHHGFDTVSAFVVADSPDGDMTFDGVDNTPSKYLSTFSDRAEGRRDPVMQFCRRHSTPIAWDESTYRDRDVAPKYETQAACGYRYGIAMGLHLPRGRHFFLGVDRDRPLPTDSAERERMVAAFALLTVYAQVGASQALEDIKAPSGEHPTPTARELEVLRWTLAGKTAWEV
jgi:hypothetical protein